MSTPRAPWDPAPVITYEAAPPRRRLNWLGAASLGLGAFSGVGEVICIIIATVMARNAGGKLDGHSPEAIAVGLFMFAGVGLALVGLTVGIVAFFLSGREKISAALGVCVSALTILGVIGLIVLGMAMR